MWTLNAFQVLEDIEKGGKMKIKYFAPIHNQAKTSFELRETLKKTIFETTDVEMSVSQLTKYYDWNIFKKAVLMDAQKLFPKLQFL